MQHRHEGTLDLDEPSPAREGVAPGRRTLTQLMPSGPTSGAPLQLRAADRGRTTAPLAGDDPFGMHLLGAPVQRHAEGSAAGGPAVDIHDTAARGVAGPGGALPHLDTIQRAFGRHDVGGIAAHTGGAAQDASEAIGARAYATGNAVAFAGAPDLHTAAHEAAHVIQQRAGVHLKGGVGEVGDAHEQHADEVADAVVAGRSAEGLLDRYAGGGGGGVQAQAVQRKKEVFSKTAFADPVTHLKGQGGKNRVIEEPGSQGILGAPDSAAIEKLGTDAGRASFLEKLDTAIGDAWEAKLAADEQATQCQAQQDAPGALAATTEAKKQENAIALMAGLKAKLADVYDVKTAAVFYRQHTLELSKIEALPKKLHNKGAANNPSYTFHKDAGLIKIEADALQGSPKVQAEKAKLINGPFGTGFVRGHNTIKNMKHRFIDHVHVNKDDEASGIDIYNTDSASDGTKAADYLEQANKVDDMLHGNDTKAIDGKIAAVNDADVATLDAQVTKKQEDEAAKKKAAEDLKKTTEK